MVKITNEIIKLNKSDDEGLFDVKKKEIELLQRIIVEGRV